MRYSYFIRRAALYSTLIALCTVIVLVYLPSIRGPFVFDDIPNIVNNEAIAQFEFSMTGLADTAWSGQSGPLKRPIAYLSFAIDSLIAGGISNTLPFRLTNLLVHLLNTVLVYVLARRLLRHLPTTGQKDQQKRHLWIPIAAAAMWALHPLHMTPVVYVVQRMASLSTVFVLLGTVVFLAGRDLLPTHPRKGWVLMWVGLSVGMLLGLLAKENAAVMPVLLLSIEYTIYNQRTRTPQLRRQLRQFYVASCAVPVLVAVAWLLTHPDLFSLSYTSRDFSPIERLLTEARVLWFYLGLLAIPDFTRFSLFHDDFPLSTGLLAPWTTLPAIVGLALLLAAGVLLRRRAALLSLAILWFFIAHSIESTIIGLELVHEHRNYLPDVALFIALPYGLARVVRRESVAALACLALGVAYGSVSFLRAQVWSHEDRLIESMARHHPYSARSQAMMGDLLAFRQYAVEDAMRHYRAALAINPADTSIPIRMLRAANFEHELGASNNRARSASILPEMTLLSDQIARQLATGKPNASVIAALDGSVDCIVEAPNNCRALYPHMLRWSRALLDNTNNTPQVRAYAIEFALRLTAWKKDYASALDVIAHARMRTPDNDLYTFLEADIYFRQGELDRAERTLMALHDADTKELGRRVSQLRSRIRSARNGYTRRP